MRTREQRAMWVPTRSQRLLQESGSLPSAHAALYRNPFDPFFFSIHGQEIQFHFVSGAGQFIRARKRVPPLTRLGRPELYFFPPLARWTTVCRPFGTADPSEPARSFVTGSDDAVSTFSQ